MTQSNTFPLLFTVSRDGEASSAGSIDAAFARAFQGSTITVEAKTVPIGYGETRWIRVAQFWL